MTDDLRNRLERLAGRADEPPDPDAFDRLDRARHRRNRSRKVGALVIASLVAIGGTATALIAFDSDRPSRVAGDRSPTADPWTPPDVLTVWPESPVREDDVTLVQTAVDNGVASLAWRLNAKSVAERFGSTVLGWSEMTVIERDVESDPGLGIVAYDISRCPPEAVCDLAGPQPTLWLVQPATKGAGGIWSVASVATPALDLDLDLGESERAGAVLFAGDDLSAELDLAEDRSAHLGVLATNGCDDVTAFETGVDAGRVTLQIPPVSPSPGCSETAVGYAFAYVQDDTTVPVGDPLLEAAAIEWPYLTLVPVRVQLLAPAGPEPSVGEEPPPAAAATIRCDDETVAVIDGVDVIAQPDGVHVRIENASSRTAVISFAESREEFHLDPGTYDVVTASPPGMETVRCAVRDAGFRGSVNLNVISE